MKKKTVTVFGSGNVAQLSPAYKTAFELGQVIANAGWALCNGGYGGTMEAAAQGAKKAGGHTIGVTCKLFRRGGPNQYIQQEVPTFDLLQRLNTLVRLGDAYVVLPGGTGTMLELALVWELFNKGLIRAERPIICVGDHWRPLVEPIALEQPDALELHFAPNILTVSEILQRYLGDSGP